VIHQIIFSGHVKKEADKVAIPADAEMACGLCVIHNVTGLTLFSDGTFMTVLEGNKQNTLDVFDVIKSDDRFAHTKVIMTNNLANSEFEDYKIGFRDNDFSDLVPQSFKLTADSFLRALPKAPSAELKILTRTFARVNNLPFAQYAA